MVSFIFFRQIKGPKQLLYILYQPDVNVLGWTTKVSLKCLTAPWLSMLHLQIVLDNDVLMAEVETSAINTSLSKITVEHRLYDAEGTVEKRRINDNVV